METSGKAASIGPEGGGVILMMEEDETQTETGEQHQTEQGHAGECKSGSEESDRRVGKGASTTRRLLSASCKQSRPAPISVGEGVTRDIASREPLAEGREIYRSRVGQDMEARQEE
jgi:hypothetical protein